jgi:16S rRNA (guanine527-N7)-methyltransferase
MRRRAAGILSARPPSTSGPAIQADDRDVESTGIVSRETDVPSGDVLGQIFGQQVAAVHRYAAILATVGVDRGLLGSREIGRIWSRHILNCVVVAPLFSPSASVCDLGSGAGLPGLVLVLARPDLHVTLLEPLQRRSTFLSEVVDELALPVEVVRARAEDVCGSFDVDYVTARAVAPIDRLAAWALPLCRPGGELLALKGATAGAELANASAALRRMGAGPANIEHVGAGVVTPLTTVVRIQSRTV